MKDHLTTVQLADRWGLAKGTLENWRIRGYGPQYIKLGKKVLYPLNLIATWESNLRSSTSETDASQTTDIYAKLDVTARIKASREISERLESMTRVVPIR